MSELLKPRIAVLNVPGTNCDEETVEGFNLTGARAEIVMVRDLIDGVVDLSDFQGLAAPGGFSYGDHIRSGKVAALEVSTRLGAGFARFIETKPVIAICNGFQEMVQLGALPFDSMPYQAVTLDRNDNGKFVHRRVNVRLEEYNNCVFLKDLKFKGPVEYQVAHGEGKFVAKALDYQDIESNGLVVFSYVDKNSEPTNEFPYNPNGSPLAIAGITNLSGLILGMMPHPERSIDRYQYPNEERLPEDFEPEGLAIFRSMVNYARQAV